jgi:CubicO group peptidase (beta-lactamase class C family)
VTVHHLLTHTGGTGEIFGPDFFKHRLELRTHDDYVRLFGKRTSMAAPGSYAYSNFGMILAGVIVERVSGQSYYEYVEEHIFKRAGMTRTGSEPENQDVSGRATGYMKSRGGDLIPNTDVLPYRGTSAGGGYSTVGDLVKFADALLNHRLSNARFTDLLMDGKVDAGEGRRYAYGFEDERNNGAGAVGHGGSAPGMSGDLRIYPKTGYVVAVLCNIDPPAARSVSSLLDLKLPK